MIAEELPALAAALHIPTSKMIRTRLLAIALLTVTACVGSPPDDGGGATNPPNPGGTTNPGGGTDPGGGGALTVGAFLDGLGHKDCDEAFACQASFPTANGTFADAFGASVDACYTDAAGYYDAAAVQAEIAAGKIHFDGAAAATCIAGIAPPATCATYWTDGLTFPAACATAISGTVADGAACVVDFDCATATSLCDATTKKCGPAPAARLAPVDGPLAHVAGRLHL